MKCPSCGADTNRSKTYCQQCGAELHPRDNSADKTLRLPDLGQIPSVSEPVRRRSTTSEKSSGGAGTVAALVCAVIAIAAVAVCLAVLMSQGRFSPAYIPTDEPEDLPYADIIVPEEEPEPSLLVDLPTNEPEDNEPMDKPQESAPDIIANDVTPAQGEPEPENVSASGESVSDSVSGE